MAINKYTYMSDTGTGGKKKPTKRETEITDRDEYNALQNAADYWETLAYNAANAPKDKDDTGGSGGGYGGWYSGTAPASKEPWNPQTGGVTLDFGDLPQGMDFSYGKAPSYIDPYQQQIRELTDRVLNRGTFEYNYETDPSYQQYAKSYGDTGRRAMQDTLAQISARTGGLASSYAVSASQQAYNNYMARLADKVPELRQAAYQMYMDQDNLARQDLAMLQGLSGTDYGRFQDALSQWDADRAYDTSMWRYGVDDARYADETAYSRSQDEYNRNLALAQLAAGYNDLRGIQSLGIDTSKAALKGTGGGVGGSSGGTSKSDARSRIEAYLKMGGSLNDLDPELLAATDLTVPELLAYSDYYGAQAAGEPAAEQTVEYPRFQNEVEAKNWLVENGAPSSALRDSRTKYGIKNERDWLHDKSVNPSSDDAVYDYYEDYVSDKAAYIAAVFGIDPEETKSKSKK